MHHFAHLTAIHFITFCRAVVPRQLEGHHLVISFAYLEVKNFKTILYDGIRKGQSLKWDRELLTFFFSGFLGTH